MKTSNKRQIKVCNKEQLPESAWENIENCAKDPDKFDRGTT